MDTFDAKLAGYVKICRANGDVVFDGRNVVTVAAVEAILRALLESDYIKNIVFASTGGIVPSPNLRSLPGVIAVSPVDLSGDMKPDTFRDVSGLKSVGRWRTKFTPAADTTFDALGLVTSGGLLMAALALAPATFTAGQAYVVEWTLALRGAGSYQPASSIS